MKTILKIELSNGRSIEKEYPYGGLPIELLEGFSIAAGFFTDSEASYTVNIEVKEK